MCAIKRGLDGWDYDPMLAIWPSYRPRRDRWFIVKLAGADGGRARCATVASPPGRGRYHERAITDFEFTEVFGG